MLSVRLTKSNPRTQMTLRHCLVTSFIAVAVLPNGVRVLASEVRQVSEAVQRYEADRETWQRAQEVLRALGLRAGAAVADVGAGGGFFTVRLSRAVGPAGEVYAVDINPTSVRKLEDRVASEHLANVKVVQGKVDSPGLPSETLDGVLISDAYHEMVEYQAMLREVRSALKPKGRLVILEKTAPADSGTPRDVQIKVHHIESRLVAQELADAGFEVVERVEQFVPNPAKYGGGVWWLLVAVPIGGDVVGQPNIQMEPTTLARSRVPAVAAHLKR
jgi:ubiquinone/menaquinone biosynthesis C-methylase UbiE